MADLKEIMGKTPPVEFSGVPGAETVHEHNE
jgi:hypothetical protein